MSIARNIELRCSRDLALRLGAISPDTVAHHKVLRDADTILVRDRITSWPMFWPLVRNVLTAESS
jgi:hypothetical protein